MPKSKLLDEILQETKNYRCEYLEILIEKYVKTEDEVVDIHIRNCTVAKRSNFLKRMEEKPFGYVSSYDCKAAKKSVHCWKKKVISKKRASFRRNVGVESADVDHRSTNTKEKLNYLTPCKAYKTLLSIQKDNSYSSLEETHSENTFLNQTDLDDDELSVSFVDEKENSFSYEDNPFLSDTQDKMFRKKETVKFLATTDKNELSIKNVQKFPNSETKNYDVNHKRLEIFIEHFSSTTSNKYDGNVSTIQCQKMGTYLKNIISSSKKETGNSNISALSVSNKSISDYISSKYTPKFRFSDIGMGILNKNSQKPNVCNVKSLLYDTKKSTEALKSTANKIGVESSNKNCQASFNYNASNKSIGFLKVNVNKMEVGTAKKNCLQMSNDCSAADLLPCATKKSAEPPKFRACENEIGKSKNNCQISSDCSAKKSLSYSTNRSTVSFKLKASETEIPASNKASSVCNSKSLICAQSNFVESPMLRFNKTVTRACNRNYKTSLNSPPLKSTSQLFPLSPNSENFVIIDPLSLKKVSNDKKLHKKKKSPAQTSLRFRSCKNYTSYLENNCKIDDFSLKKTSSPQKTPMNRRKEACQK